MQVRAIGMDAFMNQVGAPVELKLPPVGLVLITGQNGAGKSRFVEAVSYAAWGKTLRGTDPRRAGEAGLAYLATGFGMQIHRRWTSGMRQTLEVAHKDAAEDWEFDTPSKAQDHVTEVLGEWDTWRRSCAFSSVDDLSFATASDAERKRLLESLIGLARFDRALDRCRADSKAAAQVVATHRASLLRVQTQHAEAVRNLGALERVAGQQAPTVNVGVLKQRLNLVEESTKQAESNLVHERAAVRAAQQGIAEHEAKLRRLRQEIATLASAPTCPTCDQAWPDQNERRKKLMGLEHDLKTLMEEPPPRPDDQRLASVEEQVRQGRDAAAQLRAELAQAERATSAYNEAQALVKQAKVNILDMEDLVAVHSADLAAAEHTYRHLEVTDTVLGTKGARAHMLTEALAGLEAVANLWLERIARTDAPLRLRLSPYTERKSGGTADSISMEVEGAGGGRGYRAASGGERRRIDVAIMLALGEVAQRADNRVSPTMFFDEVFDSLDVAGVEAVAGALDQLAQDRCVVVMSHSQELIMNLVPDIRLHVSGGAIEHK